MLYLKLNPSADHPMPLSFNSLSDLSSIEWDGTSESCICVLKTRITRNPAKRRVQCTFAEMDTWIPAFSRIMWHRPYEMNGDSRYSIENLTKYLRRLPANCTEPLLMLHEPIPQSLWEGVTRSTSAKNTFDIATGSGHSYLLYKDMEANATGFAAVFDRCEALGVSANDTARVLKHCMANGSLINHQLDIQACLSNTLLWSSIEIAGHLGCGWIEPIVFDVDAAALPDNLAFRTI